jgi:hypothetical protein
VIRAGRHSGGRSSSPSCHASQRARWRIATATRARYPHQWVFTPFVQLSPLAVLPVGVPLVVGVAVPPAAPVALVGAGASVVGVGLVVDPLGLSAVVDPVPVPKVWLVSVLATAAPSLDGFDSAKAPPAVEPPSKRCRSEPSLGPSPARLESLRDLSPSRRPLCPLASLGPWREAWSAPGGAVTGPILRSATSKVVPAPPPGRVTPPRPARGN